MVWQTTSKQQVAGTRVSTDGRVGCHPPGGHPGGGNRQGVWSACLQAPCWVCLMSFLGRKTSRADTLLCKWHLTHHPHLVIKMIPGYIAATNTVGCAGRFNVVMHGGGSQFQGISSGQVTATACQRVSVLQAQVTCAQFHPIADVSRLFWKFL